MSPITAETTDVRDWLAVRAGWVREPKFQRGFEEKWFWHRSANIYNNNKPERIGWTHPYPHTRDAAADAMPKHWTWERATEPTGPYPCDFVSIWKAYRMEPSFKEVRFTVPATSDEIANRFTLAALCVLADEEEPHGPG
jgi:hypothetical protein